MVLVDLTVTIVVRFVMVKIDTLWTHLNIQCQVYPYRLEDKRKNFSDENSDEDSIEDAISRNIEVDEFEAEAKYRARQQGLRAALAQIIVMDALPIRIVEGKGFKRYCSFLAPDFELPSRTEVARDVMKL